MMFIMSGVLSVGNVLEITPSSDLSTENSYIPQAQELCLIQGSLSILATREAGLNQWPPQ